MENIKVNIFSSICYSVGWRDIILKIDGNHFLIWFSNSWLAIILIRVNWRWPFLPNNWIRHETLFLESINFMHIWFILAVHTFYLGPNILSTKLANDTLIVTTYMKTVIVKHFRSNITEFCTNLSRKQLAFYEN